MSAWSPTTEGFRAMFRRPALSLAEIVWRWSFGAAACVLLGLASLAYLDTLPVDRTDMVLLRTRQPVLIGQAFSHILHGSALRVAFASIILFSGLGLLWILLASLGRGATLIPLIAYIRESAKAFANSASITHMAGISTIPSGDRDVPWHIRSLAGLNFLRASLALGAIAGAIGATILAGFVSSKDNPRPGTVFFLASGMLLLLWLIWSTVSWFLSVAAIFVVRQGQSTFEALSSAVDLCRDQFGAVMAVGTWFGLAHVVVFFAASSVVALPLALIPAVPTALALTAVLLLTLAYFAIVDTLHIGRLAGYVAILEAPPAPPPIVPADSVAPDSAISVQPETTMVDQDELILSDTPSPFDSPSVPSAVPPDAALLDQGTQNRTHQQSEATSPHDDNPRTETSS